MATVGLVLLWEAAGLPRLSEPPFAIVPLVFGFAQWFVVGALVGLWRCRGRHKRQEADSSNGDAAKAIANSRVSEGPPSGPLSNMSASAKGLMIGASPGFALTILGWLPAVTSRYSGDVGAAMVALTVSAPAFLLSRQLRSPFSNEGSAMLVFVSAITNMVLLAAPLGLIGYCTRFLRRTR